jgi:uncharacterized protein YggU (UPF0235/DUF167 family)
VATPGSLPWVLSGDGARLTVRLTPRGGRDAIDGVARLDNGRSVLKVRVRAAASDGEANAALGRLIARAMGVPPRDVALVAGTTARLKTLHVAGNGPALIAALEKIVSTR